MLLIVEDDAAFARILLDMAREKGFKVVAAARGTIALTLAQELKPDAITLDMQPARHRRLDGARPPQGRPGHAPHPGAHHLRRPTSPSARCSQGALAFLTKPVPKELLSEAFGGS